MAKKPWKSWKVALSMIDAGEHESSPNYSTSFLPACREVSSLSNGSWNSATHPVFLPYRDALAHLGDALGCRSAVRARKETFEQLVDRDPESDSAKRKPQSRAPQNGLLEVVKRKTFQRKTCGRKFRNPAAQAAW